MSMTGKSIPDVQPENAVKEHYRGLLAPIYNWMAGGYEQQVERQRAFFEAAGLTPQGIGKALDLGCGSGFQTLALAELGFHVIGVDTSDELLGELRSRCTTDHVQLVHGDMRRIELYRGHAPFELAVCMGDSLLHLQSLDDVAQCVEAVRLCVVPGGRFVTSFRDLTTELHGIDRIVPVKMDDNRLMLTFLEYEPHHLSLHDVVMDRQEGTWRMQKSAYKKLRLSPVKFGELLDASGFVNVRQRAADGYTTTIAELPR